MHTHASSHPYSSPISLALLPHMPQIHDVTSSHLSGSSIDQQIMSCMGHQSYWHLQMDSIDVEGFVVPPCAISYGSTYAPYELAT